MANIILISFVSLLLLTGLTLGVRSVVARRHNAKVRRELAKHAVTDPKDPTYLERLQHAKEEGEAELEEVIRQNAELTLRSLEKRKRASRVVRGTPAQA